MKLIKKGIDDADLIVFLSYGKENNSGSTWECGYGFGTGKKIILVEMTDDCESLMVSNSAWAIVKGLSGLAQYDFKVLPQIYYNLEKQS